MKYALNLAADGRILSASYQKFAPADAVIVEALPDGNIYEYRYVNGEYIHDPLPEQPEAEEQQTYEERIAELEEALAMLLSGVTE